MGGGGFNRWSIIQDYGETRPYSDISWKPGDLPLGGGGFNRWSIIQDYGETRPYSDISWKPVLPITNYQLPITDYQLLIASNTTSLLL